jgi:hypothetical protein
MIMQRTVIIIAHNLVQIDVEQAIARNQPPTADVGIVRTADNEVRWSHAHNLTLTHRGNDPIASSSRPNRRARGKPVIVEIGRATKQPMRTPKR